MITVLPTVRGQKIEVNGKEYVLVREETPTETRGVKDVAIFEDIEGNQYTPSLQTEEYPLWMVPLSK